MWQFGLRKEINAWLCFVMNCVTITQNCHFHFVVKESQAFIHHFSYTDLPYSEVCKYKDIFRNETCYLHCAWLRIITSKNNHMSKKWCYMKTKEDTVAIYNPESAYILLHVLVFLKF